MKTDSHASWTELAHRLGAQFAPAAAAHDSADTFVKENYDALKEHKVMSAAIPEEFGGGGVSHAEMCEFLRILGGYCGSTALALSMHQHLLAAAIWRQRRGQGGEAMLKNVAAKQLVLVSTGAQDWLESSGSMEKAEGGFVVTAVKHFASQSAAGDMLMTSAPYDDPAAGRQVLHFALPFSTTGVRVLGNWRAMGMRGTGSHSVALEKAFVPEASISVRRPAGVYHPVWNVILTVAMPLIMSVYLGVAQRAARIATDLVKSGKQKKAYHPALVGAMHNELTAAELHVADMIRIANNLEFAPEDKNGHDILTRKTNSSTACVGVVTKAMEIAGGQGFLRELGLERLYRDVLASRYHPLQEKEQLQFSGEFILRQ
jgi:alkylation response protein AidB-like acyl-CoA dehydrogenase